MKELEEELLATLEDVVLVGEEYINVLKKYHNMMNKKDTPIIFKNERYKSLIARHGCVVDILTKKDNNGLTHEL